MTRLSYSNEFVGKKKTKSKPEKFFTINTFKFLLDFISGKKLNLETHMILGNHDIDNCSGEHLIKRIYDVFEKNMIYEEQKLTLNKNHYYFSNQIIKHDRNYILIGLDTNKGFIKNLNEILESIIDPEFNKWIILAGHEPLTSIKIKNTKTKQKIKNITSIFNLLNKIDYRKIAPSMC